MQRLADDLLGHRSAVLAGLAGLTLLFAFGLTRLQFDDVPSSIYRTDDEDYERLRELQRVFGSDEHDALIVLEAEDFFTAETATLLRELDLRLQAIEGVQSAFGLSDVVLLGPTLMPTSLLPSEGERGVYERARTQARQHPLVADQLLAQDGRTALMIVRLSGEELAVSQMQPVLESIATTVDELTADSAVRGRLTGIPPLRTAIFREIGRELGLFSVTGCLLALLVGVALFRSRWAVIAILATTTLAAVSSAGLMGLVGQPLNLLTSGLPLLVLVVALTDGTHVVLDIQRSLRNGSSPHAAAHHAIRSLAGPCCATSLTTAVGFGSLAFSRVETVSSFGTLSFLSIGLAFLFVTTVVPLSASFLKEGPTRQAPDLRPRPDGRAAALMRGVLGHAKAITAVTLVLSTALFLFALRLEPDNRLTESVPRESPATQALSHCEAAFGGSLQAAVMVEWSADNAPSSDERLQVFQEIEAVLDAHPFTHGVLSPARLLEVLPPSVERNLASLKSLPAQLVDRFLERDGQRALVTARVPDARSRIATAAWEEIEVQLADIARRHPAFELNVSGSGWLVRRNIDWMIEDFARGLGLAVILIFGVLTLTFRSWRLGLISILPNALPLLAAAGTLHLFGVDLQAASAIAFTIALGIAVDDTIHFMSRMRFHRRAGATREEALQQSFLDMLGPLVVTTAVVVAGVSVFFLSTVPTTRLFAGITTVGVSMALVCDLFVLPAVLWAFSRPRASYASLN